MGGSGFTTIALSKCVVSQASKWNLDFKYFTGSSATGRVLFQWLNKFCKKLFMKRHNLSEYAFSDFQICLELKRHLNQMTGRFYIADTEPLKDQMVWNNPVQAGDWLNITCRIGTGDGLLACMECAVIEDQC